MKDVAQLLFPAIRWEDGRGYDGARPMIDQALQLGVGGFILFGGTQDAVRALTRELQQRSRTPLLIGADMERGAGQQFVGATGLPPLAAIASLNDADAVRRAARLTARESRTLGVNWAYGPVCDLDVLPENPIVGTRSLGASPKRVAELASEWIDACQSEGVLACAKHFPGHGRTAEDSHAALPVVTASAETLHQEDLVPFRAAIDAGVGSMMTAHVAYPALDPTGTPATLSREILTWLLRQQLGFDGLVVTDAFIMEGVLAGTSEAEAAVGAVRAGCDVVLYPRDIKGVAAALEQALKVRQLDTERVRQSMRRRLKWAQWVSPPNDYRRPSAADAGWGAQLADRVVHALRGRPMPLRQPVDVYVIDDDEGGPYAPPSREPFFAALRAAGIEARPVTRPDGGESRSTLLVALFGDVRSWKGRPGYSPAARAAVDFACTAAASAARDITVVQFSHPRLAAEIPRAPAVLCAWGGDPAMQQAAARWLVRNKG